MHLGETPALPTRRVILPFEPDRAGVAAMTRVKSTLLHSSQQSLRERGHFAAYARSLGSSDLEAIRSQLAPAWLPGRLALAHYRACDSLDLPPSECVALGQRVSTLSQGTVAATLVRLARQTGATPLVLMSSYQRLWARVWTGSAVSVVQVGPKDVEIEIAHNECVGIPYFRAAFRGIVAGISELVCARAFCRESRLLDDGAAFRLMWA
jgi:hypothetical protein